MLQLKDLKPQYILNNAGEKESVIISISKFQEFIEEVKELLTIAEKEDEINWSKFSLHSALKGMEDEESLYTENDIKEKFS